jgi:iron complex transport system substrate-binding protein
LSVTGLINTQRQPRRHRSSSRLLFAIVSVVLVTSACFSNRQSPADNKTIVDEMGHTVRVPQHPQRIVSLAPSITEILFAIGAADRIAGVTSYCDYPPEAVNKERVGDTLKPNIEKIVAMKADLVIISTSSQLETSFRRLEELQVPVYISNPRTVDQVIDSIDRIGDLVDASKEARDVTRRLRNRVAAVEARVAGSPRPSVLVLLGTEPLITIGSASFINDLIERAGGRSISADDKADYPQYSVETVIAKQPEIILLQTGSSELGERLRQTPAARSNKVFHIDDDLLLRPGPRLIDGLEQIAAKFHPDLFQAENANKQ